MPAMATFMREHIDLKKKKLLFARYASGATERLLTCLRTIAHYERWGQEGDLRILHSSIGERARQDERIVPSPGVWGDELLRNLDDFLGVLLELPSARAKNARLGPDAGPLAEGLKGEFSPSDGDEVGWNRDGLVEFVGVGRAVNGRLRGRRGRRGAACREEDGKGRVHDGGVGELDGRGVLAGCSRRSVGQLSSGKVQGK